jgi:hypothetical protein
MSYKNLTYKVVRREDGPRSTKYLKDAQNGCQMVRTAFAHMKVDGCGVELWRAHEHNNAGRPHIICI